MADAVTPDIAYCLLNDGINYALKLEELAAKDDRMPSAS